jgi:hypothetical protein
MDVFYNLPRLTWRGITVPVAERRVSFAQEIARHKYAYRDDEIIESLGRQNLRFEYTIPFRQDITKGPYQNLFIEVYPEFLRACRESTEGDLNDPVLGPFTARVEQVNTMSDVNRRDGDDVQVTFIESPSLEAMAQFVVAPMAGFDTTAQQGKTLNDQIAPIADTVLDQYNLGKFQSDFDALTSSVDALDKIAGIGAQIAAYADQVDAVVSRYEHKVNKIADVLDKIDEVRSSPLNAPAIRSVRRLVDAINRTKNQLAFPGRRILTQTLGQDMPPAAVAQFPGLTMAEFILLNPSAILPLVPAGTVVSYYQK